MPMINGIYYPQPVRANPWLAVAKGLFVLGSGCIGVVLIVIMAWTFKEVHDHGLTCTIWACNDGENR